MPPRPSSSVYLEPFHLDDILQQISEQEWRQEIRTLHALIDENEELKAELNGLRRIWGLIYKIMMQVNKAAEQLYMVTTKAGRVVDKQRKIWIANCTAF
ncbi:hypothetical protein QBC46DRAFT_275272 [Diplogelasinospora grovesii]|uniref:Uncharacterized protein n=1 Tax=Diplogelasinospora grovesii TaxID=303347 RepID=A0AAN6MUG2_9PEZI|nr:hypothetical protein QBC46DRAFT_275272 [Diplogelasinospora grovesii]